MKEISERELVMGILLEVTRDGVYSHIALRNVLGKYQYMDKKERAFITRVVEGTLEHMMEIDYIINQFSKVKVNKMKPVIRTIIRSAVYQLKYMDSVPNSAVCNEAVKLAVKKGFAPLKGFVNGVLRNIERNLDQITYPDKSNLLQYYSVRYSMPEWIVTMWLDQYGEEVLEKILADFQIEKATTIRINTKKITKADLIKKLKQQEVQVEEHPYLPYALLISNYNYLGELESFQKGEFSVQDISSMLVGEIACPKEHDYIIDVCAAPGGKALHLGEKLNQTGMVLACDLTDYKVQLIEDNISRVGKGNVKAIQKDACIYDEQLKEKADILIADLPCSGLGVLGKKTDLKYKMTEKTADDLVVLQRKILTNVKEYVKPGGILIYSTCTIHEEENMGQVKWFLENFEFQLEPFEDILCSELKGVIVEPGCMQLLPGIQLSDGFFVAKFRKVK